MYKFKFKDKSIEEYFFKNVIDPERVSTKECIEKKLPYIDSEGWMRNTEAFLDVNIYFKENDEYPNYPTGSKEWKDFWIDQEKRNRCSKGFWLGQVRITKYFYYFLTYHPMKMGKETEYGDVVEQESLGDWWFIHFQFFHILEYCQKIGLDFSLIKPRGCGLSECAASLAECDLFVPLVDTKTDKPLAFKSHQIYASDKSYLQGEGKIFDIIYDATNWINSFGKNHGLYKPIGVTQKNSNVMHLVPGYITEGGKGKSVQTGGSIEALGVKSADKGVGGRKSFFLIEESGTFQHLGPILKKIRPNTIRRSKKGDVKTGTILIWGTSNADERGIESFKSVLTSPFTYGCVSFEDVWSQVKNNPESINDVPKYAFEYMLPKDSKEGIGWFIPYYDSFYMDKDGNPLRKKSLEYINKKRIELLQSAKTDKEKDDIMKEIADHPITMQEALMVSRGKFFQSDELIKQAVNLETKVIEPKIYRGNFDWVVDDHNGIIKEVRWFDNPRGKHLILEHPKWAYKKNNYMVVDILKWKEYDQLLYIGGIDSIDQSEEDSTGKGSNLACLLKKRFSAENAVSDPYLNSYVSLYNQRSRKVKDDQRNVVQNLLYFNALALLEYTKITIKNYIVDELKLGRLLAYEPKSPGTVIKNYKAQSRKKGIRITKDIIFHYLNLCSDYLDGNAKKIFFMELINQLTHYSYEDKTNYDLIAAMGMAELLDTEFRDVLVKTNEKKEPVIRSMKWIRNPITGIKEFTTEEELDPELRTPEENRQVRYYDMRKLKPIYE